MAAETAMYGTNTCACTDRHTVTTNSVSGDPQIGVVM